MTKCANDGVFALRTESYHLPGQAERLLQKTDRAWWGHPAVILFLTISMSAMDALVLYDVMDVAMVQSEMMGYLVSFGVALVLNIIPLITAKLVRQAVYGTKRYALTWAIVSVAAFLLLFASTVYLRFDYQEIYANSAGAGMLVNQAGAGAAAEEAPEQQALAIMLLLSVEPLVTSVLNFLLSWISDDELEQRIKYLRLRRLELLEIRSDLQAALANMEMDRQQLLDLDDARYQAARQVIISRSHLLQARARQMLAQWLANPSATTKLSQEALGLPDNPEPDVKVHRFPMSA